MTLKKIIGKIHLWLGLSSGLVVFIVAVTGCIYVFEQEINQLLQTGVYRPIVARNEPFIGPQAIRQHVASKFEGQIKTFNATLFPNDYRANVIWVRDETRSYTAFLLNPYSGDIIHSYPYKMNFWAIVLGLHTHLLIPEIGQHLVAACTLIFVILMISGLFLWFPGSKKGYKQRFRIKWQASPKRLNYDLHNVLGFYMTWIAIFIAITGLAWSYQWMKDGIYWVATGGEPLEVTERAPAKSQFIVLHDSTETKAVDSTFHQLISKYPGVSECFILYPRDSSDTYAVTIMSDQGSTYNKNDKYWIDQYSGKIVREEYWNSRNSGEKLQEANYNIHVGAILGLPGKLLAFFASLITASLPVTGFYIWYGRRKKKKQNNDQPAPEPSSTNTAQFIKQEITEVGP